MQNGMSAFTPDSGMCGEKAMLHFVPKAVIPCLFDHLISNLLPDARTVKTEGLHGVEI